MRVWVVRGLLLHYIVQVVCVSSSGAFAPLWLSAVIVGIGLLVWSAELARAEAQGA